MKEFFLIWFFSKTILLTPAPIVVNSDSVLAIDLGEPVKAIAKGANIQIDTTEMLGFKNGDILGVRSIVKENFADETITAILSNENSRLELEFTGSTSIDNDAVRLILTAEAFPLDVEFSRLEIRTSKRLDHVFVCWKNYSH